MDWIDPASLGCEIIEEYERTFKKIPQQRISWLAREEFHQS